MKVPTPKAPTKLENLIHYIVWKCQNPTDLGAVKLNKILWFSDAFSYLEKGVSITGVSYEKRQFGPVPKPRDFLAARDSLEYGGKIARTKELYHNKPQEQLVALERPDLSLFSADDISLVDFLIEDICNNHTATSISEISHDIIWKAAEIGEEIPLKAVFAAQVAEINADDINWAKSQIQKLRVA